LVIRGILLSGSSFSIDLKIEMSRRSIVLAIIIVGLIIAFGAYVCASLVVSYSNVGSFEGKLQEIGFEINHASSRIAPDLQFLPPQETVVCQNQTQFIQEALLVNSTGIFRGSSTVFLLDGVHFYAITTDNRTSMILGYEYTPSLPSPLDAVIIYWFGSNS